MNKGELLEAIAAHSGQTKSDVQKVMDSLTNAVTDALKAKDKVVLRRFGTFMWADREDGQEVVFQVSPHFTQLCMPQEAQPSTTIQSATDDAPDPEEAVTVEVTEEAATAEVVEEMDNIAILRGMLARTPSAWAWSKIVEFFGRWKSWEDDYADRELPVSYAQNHIAQHPGWQPYAYRDDGIPDISPMPHELLTGLTEGALQRHEAIRQAMALQDEIDSLEKSTWPQAYAQLSAKVDPAQIAVTGHQLHPKDWPPSRLEPQANDLKALQEIANSAGLAQRGFVLTPMYNKNQVEIHTTLVEDYEDEASITMAAEVFLIGPQGKGLLRFRTEGRYAYTFNDDREMVFSVDVYDAVRLLVNDTSLLLDFDSDEMRPTRGHKKSGEYDVLEVTAGQLLKRMQKEFPDHKRWQATDGFDAPLDARKLLEGLIEYLRPLERPEESEFEDEDY